ncbi:NAD(P)/FAD-dependent oxidoreductase [Lonepinella sp. MS14436]|uniref:NAD(P)/FAD-dependent oxidoreductase n=1 Tax=Lonepinella sp. MS14436 TaxID=3003619 RepID=UPI0036D9DB7F
MEKFDVVIIGAGPSGTVSAALLRQQGLSVLLLEKQHFPRFVIGESLLSYAMDILEQAGLADAVRAEPTFQFKNGAAFSWGERYAYFDFNQKFTSGPGTTLQVRRAIFDKILADEVMKKGAVVRYGHSVEAVDNHNDSVILTVNTDQSEHYQVEARFVLDASGYGRVLPRLFNLDIPSNLPMRIAHFTHIEDNISDPTYDRNKILITTHPEHRDIWLWLIPFADNRCSIGVVGLPEKLTGESESVLKQFALDSPVLKRLLVNAKWETDFPYLNIKGYSANVKSLHGKNFALLGNAAEFLDPVFSSGVTIALHSARLAAPLIVRQLAGEQINWQKEFTEPLMVGVNAFRTYVNGWYDGSFQDVVYAKNANPEIRAMISSILAGYAWDTSNPYVAKSDSRLKALAEICGIARITA